MNLPRAVRISGDGGQEGRHLAKKKKVGNKSTETAYELSQARELSRGGGERAFEPSMDIGVLPLLFTNSLTRAANLSSSDLRGRAV